MHYTANNGIASTVSRHDNFYLYHVNHVYLLKLVYHDSAFDHSQSFIQ